MRLGWIILLIQRQSIRIVWYAGIGFAGLGWLLVCLEKEVPLRSKLDTKFGLEEKHKRDKEMSKQDEKSSA